MFAASDFLTVEVWTGRGLVTHYLLFVISLADRAVDVLGLTARPDEAWMLQLRRTLIDSESGALRGKRYLIIDRPGVAVNEGALHRRLRLGGMLNFYYRQAA